MERRVSDRVGIVLLHRGDPATPEDAKGWLKTAYSDPIAYRRSSPIEFADGLQGSLLICHGMIDDNVFFEDSVRLFQRLMELHKDDVEFAPYPMERHGFVHADSWLDEYKRIERLFETHIGGTR